MIKAILFDYDGVLTTDKTGSLTTNAHLSKVSGVEVDVLNKAFAVDNQDLLLGRTTHAEIWDAVCESIQHSLDFDELEHAFLSIPVNASMFALAR